MKQLLITIAAVVLVGCGEDIANQDSKSYKSNNHDEIDNEQTDNHYYAIDSYKGINILNGVYSDFKHVLEPEPASTTKFQDTIYSIKDSEFLKIGITEFEKGKSAIAFNYKNEFSVLRLWTYNLKGRELLIDALITKYGNPSSREKGEIEEKIIWVDNKNSTKLKLDCFVSPFNDGMPPDLMTLILSNQKSLKAQEDFEKSQTLKDL